jgi:phosphomannomutase
MPLIKSIAGIRGTIGGSVGEGLTPIDIVQITAAFGQQILSHKDPQIIIGKDARQSGFMISQLVSATLQSLGIAVIDLGLTTTPTLALAVKQLQATGGIMVSASHNPSQWNALKLLNQTGEYIDAITAEAIFSSAEKGNFSFAATPYLGQYTSRANYIDQHIQQILALPLVDTAAIARRKFKIAVDTINSVGSIAIPKLLQALGVSVTKILYDEPNGVFAHDPEPLPEHLEELSKTIQWGDYDVGIAVDPDVDRLALIDEKGQAWGEDYTLVAAADYVLSQTPGNTVSNLSSTSVLQTITERYGGQYIACPVGEMHVVAAMKTYKAIIGGEGNGGVIYPALHYNRDALVGIALVLSHLARSGKKASEVRAGYPNAVILKRKIALDLNANTELIFKKLKSRYNQYRIDMQEGIKIYLDRGWLHVRKSNTEAVVRLYVEGANRQIAEAIMQEASAALDIEKVVVVPS